jgi:hypothetical protein
MHCVVVYIGEAMSLNPDVVYICISKVLFLFLGGKLVESFMRGTKYLHI